MARIPTSRFPLAVVAGALLPLTAACDTGDAMGPGDPSGGGEPPAPVTAVISARITEAYAIHDCDPNKDNPGDFRIWLEILQDSDPSAGSSTMEVVKRTSNYNFTIDTESDNTTRNLSSQVAISGVYERDPARPLSIRAFMQERDSGTIDAEAVDAIFFQWSDQRGCWTSGGSAGCHSANSSGGQRASTTREVFPREDEFKLFNSDDEGCRFGFTLATDIS